MSKVIFLPLDERPCNYIYPEYIGKISGFDLCIPPKSLMGKFKQPADVEQLWQWAFDHVKGASHVVISMDLMLYGGIVPSRLHHLSPEICKERIDRVEKLKEIEPKVQIYGFQLITRAPARDGSGEEPDYYENYGYRIFQYGVIRDRISVGVATEEEKRELEDILDQVPKEYLQDFLDRRKVNFQNHLETIGLVER